MVQSLPVVRSTTALLVAMTLVVITTTVSAQTVADPRVVEFKASSDHTTAVTRYELGFFNLGATSPFLTNDLGKPAPGADGVIRLDLSKTLSAWPVPGVTYEARVAAVGPGGTSQSNASNPFYFTGTPCTYALSASSLAVGSSGGTGSVGVAAGAGCAWTATSHVAWITVSAGASGSGSGSVGFTVAANTSTSGRTGTLTIAGQTFTINQAGVSCTYSLSATTQVMTVDGGLVSVGVTAQTGCSWTAASHASWITVTAGKTGSGIGTVTFSVAANTAGGARTGTLTIAGQTFTVSQPGATCTYSLSTTSQSIGSEGGNTAVDVTTPADCTWTATSQSGWISVASGATGSGNGTVGLSIAANSSESGRTGTLTIAGQAVTITQDGLSCSYSLSPRSTSLPASGGSGSAGVQASAGNCSWTASSHASWISITSGSKGSGSAAVAFSVTPNPQSSMRTGSLTVAGEVFTVVQEPGSTFNAPQTAPTLPAPTGPTVVVSTVDELQNAVAALRSGDTIVVQPGVYELTRELWIGGVSGVGLRGASSNRGDVVIKGAGMHVAGAVQSALHIGSAQDVLIANLSIGEVGGHPVQVHGDRGAARVRLYNVRIYDGGRQLVKATSGPGGGAGESRVEYSVIEYSDLGPPHGDTAGLDVENGSDWHVHSSLFRNLRVPAGATERSRPAILMWSGSRGTMVYNNTFVDCERAIVFGIGRQSGFENSHTGGAIYNNFVHRQETTYPGPSFSLLDSPGTRLYHNTIVQNGTHADAIEARGATTVGLEIANNLTDAAIGLRAGAKGALAANYTQATPALFVNAAAGDLHLRPDAAPAKDGGVFLSALTFDWDGEARPQGLAPDLGADELPRQAAPNVPPTVQLVAPEGGSAIRVGEPVQLVADAADVDGRIVKVEFYANGSLIASAGAQAFAASWAPPGPGRWRLHAVATDDGGAQATSETVIVHVKR